MARPQKKDRNRKIVLYRKRKNLSFRQISAIFDINVSAVYTIWSRDKNKYK